VNEWRGVWRRTLSCCYLRRGDASRLNKADKKASKAAAAQVLAVMSGDGVKAEAFKLASGQKIEFSSLEARVRRDALRECLGSGFQVHMSRNPFLRETFGHAGDGPVASKAEQKWRSADAKACSQKQRQRASSSQQAAHLLQDW